MSAKLNFFIILFSIFFIILLLNLLKNNKISVKYALVWLLPSFLFLISAFFPNVIKSISLFLGFKTMVSFIFSMLFAFLLVICIVLTIIVTRLRERQKTIIQELSIMKSENQCHEK